jgi:hypothetical protein
MAKTLATAVHLTDESGIVHSFLPGQTPPKWARPLITNPKAWSVDDADEVPDGTVVDETPDTAPDESIHGEAGDSEVPKKNASTADWRAYADKHGFETDDDIKRDEIIAALTAAGIPTE